MKPETASRMSGVDAAFLYLERKEIPVPVAGVFILDGPIDFEQFIADLDAKLDLVPKYRQLICDTPFNIGHPTWKPDPNFDIRRHIFRVRLKKGTQAELEALAGRLVGEPMDRAKPLWEFHVVDGLKNGRGALITLWHHALVDGVSAAGMLNVILESTPKRIRRTKRKQPTPPPDASVGQQSTFEAAGSAVRSMFESFVSAEATLFGMAGAISPGSLKTAGGLLGLAPELLAPVEPLPFNKQCTGDRKFCWTEIDIPAMQAIRAAGGGTLNDVALTTVVRALARYCEMHRESVINRFVRIVCPVNLRPPGQYEALGNQITFLPVVLPMGIKDPLKHLQEVSRRMEIMKSARAADLMALVGNWIGATPPPVQKLFWYGLPLLPLPLPLFNMIFTNIPASRVPLYAGGRRILALYPHVPTGYVLGVNCAVLSYCDKLFFGFTADAHAASDVHRLRDFVSASFKELCRSAGVKQPRRPAAEVTRKRTAAPQKPKRVAPKRVAPKPVEIHAAAKPAVPATPDPEAPHRGEKKPAALAARA